MKQIRTADAVGQALCHDVTKIVRGVTKDVAFQKGHIITESDVPVLLYLGKEHVYVWEDDENMLHENEAAEILVSLCINKNMYATEPKEGKIELIANRDGLLMVDTKRLRTVNSIGGLMIATRPSGIPVKKGDKLCGTRIIPLTVEKTKMEQVCKIAGKPPLLKLLPLKKKKYGLINTGNEVFYGRIRDTFTPVIQEKMAEYGCKMVASVTIEDDPEKIAAAIRGMLASGAQMVLCTGGMSVDPDDRTPFAIKNTADKIISYGAPVLPGAMFMLAYMKDGIPICGLPGCVMYSKRTIFDIVLPHLLADVQVTPEWLTGLGEGGLCLDCEICIFPNCAFGKGK
ncbi:MAG: molybdopterin-binding protein [Oscillospiraceae bacterium]|nr:molybdopterin-binding protein [Oscillospiraceae bacterium]